MQSARTALAGGLTGLIAEIQRQDAAGRAWQLAPADLQRLLGLTPEQYYRAIYGAQMAGHPLISLALAAESFSQASILPLVNLLEQLCGAGTESALERAGIFFSRDQQAELTAQFLGAAAHEVGAHRFRADEFTAMLRTFGSAAHARRVYLEHYFDLEDLQRRAARRYCAGREFTIPGLALRNAEGVLRFLFSKHVLRADNLFGALHGAFLAAAAAAGYADDARRSARRARRESRAAPPSAPSAADQARKALGLEPGPLTPERLKSRYKQLMKRFHPDVNPHGLRRCQEITVAYSTLVTGGGVVAS